MSTWQEQFHHTLDPGGSELGPTATTNNHNVEKEPEDHEKLRQYFGYAPAEVSPSIEDLSNGLHRHWKSRNPAFNTRRRSEAVATDTVWE